MSLRERRAAERNQIGKSTCFLHPESRLKMKNGDAWCGDCGSKPVTKARVVSETEKYLTGDPTQNAAIRSKLKDKHGDMTVTSDNALVLREPTEVEIKAAGRQFSNMVAGFGNNISDADLHLAAQLKVAGFLPQHFNVVHGNLYLNFLGATFWTKQTFGIMDGGSSHRPMTAEEREFYRLEDSEVGVVATYHKVVGGSRFEVATDIGRAGGTRDNEKNPIAMANRPEMAIKRALVRVMRQAAPLGVQIATYDAEIGMIEDVQVAEQPAIESPAPASEKRVTVSPMTAQATVALISELENDRFDIDLFSYDGVAGKKGVLEMLRGGHTPDEVADAVALVSYHPEHDVPPPVHNEEVLTVVTDGVAEDVEELPW